MVIDKIIRYESLQDDVDNLGFGHLELPDLKTKIRKSKSSYRQYYTDKLKNIVARKNKRVISYFKYVF
jgi:hypothetical protein